MRQGNYHQIIPNQFAATFNCNGTVELNLFHVDDNAMFENSLQPFIVPKTGVLRILTTSTVLSGSATYEISVYQNGAFVTTVSVSTATSINDINIPVVRGDTLYILASKASGAGSMTDMIVELFAWFGTSTPVILDPLEIFGSSLGWWFRAGDWTLSGTDITDMDNLEGTASRDATGTSETAAYFPQAVTEDGLDAIRFDGIDVDSKRQYLTWDTDFEALGEGEMFIIGKLDADPPAAGGNTGWFNLGTAAFPTNYPWIDGIIYDSFGRTTQFTTANPATSLTTQHCYNVKAKAADPIWASYINGNNVITSSAAAFTQGFPATGNWGRCSPGPVFTQGYGFEAIGLNTLATVGQKNLLGLYFASRGYSFTWANF